MTTITRSTSIPIIDAASRSNEVARMAFPVRVCATNTVSTILSPSADRIVRIRGIETFSGPSWIPLIGSIRLNVS